MKAEDRFDAFERRHAQALESIRSHMSSTNDDVRKIVNWLVTTDRNPYSLLPESWAASFQNAIGFSSLCGAINHAVTDDGEMNLVAVNGEPRITFVERCRKDFEDAVLTDQERDIKVNRSFGGNMTYDVEILDGVDAFIEASRRYEIDSLRKCFTWDAERDLDRAIRHYGKNPLFREEWILEIESDNGQDG